MPKSVQLSRLAVKEQRFYSQLPTSELMTLYITKAEPSHPMGKTNFGLLYSQSRSFGHYQELLTVAEDWNVDRPVNQKFCLVAQPRLHHNIHIIADAAPTSLSI